MRRTVNKATIAYEFIKEQIAQGVWSEHRLPSAAAIAAMLDMSRSPVWSALKRLESEGWVSIVPQVGVMVQSVDRRTLEEILTARAVLEGWVAGVAARLRRDEDISQAMALWNQMEHLVRQGNSREYAQANVAFHDLILGMANPTVVQELIDRLRDRTLNARWSPVLFAPDAMRQSHLEHRQCLEAIRDGDSNRARTLMEAHLMRVVDLVRNTKETPS